MDQSDALLTLEQLPVPKGELDDVRALGHLSLALLRDCDRLMPFSGVASIAIRKP